MGVQDEKQTSENEEKCGTFNYCESRQKVSPALLSCRPSCGPSLPEITLDIFFDRLLCQL